MDIDDFPCHTQSAKICVKLVTEASNKVQKKENLKKVKKVTVLETATLELHYCTDQL